MIQVYDLRNRLQSGALRMPFVPASSAQAHTNAVWGSAKADAWRES